MRVGFLGDVYLAHDKAHPPEVADDLQALLAGCDHVVANLEGPLASVARPIAKKGPVMRQSPAIFGLLDRLRVDVVGLANNHIADHGAAGIAETRTALRAAGRAAAGAGSTLDEIYQPLVLSGERASLALLVAAENGFGCADEASPAAAGYAWLFSPRFARMLARAARTVDFVVVFVHAGVEHMRRPLPDWRLAYRRLVEGGASAVIAHHPHLTQGYERYRGAPIFYSLGNLYFDSRRPRPPHWYASQLPILRFEKGREIGLELHHPEFALAGAGRVALERSGRGEAASARLGAELASPGYGELVDQDLRTLWRTTYGPRLDRACNGFSSLRSVPAFGWRLLATVLRGRPFADPMMLEHLLEIESHRWALAAIMRLQRHDHSALRDFAR